jgi:TrmH family RNA methyltransferase
MTITSRQNPLVARFREAVRGEPADVVLLDGAHLVADALAADLDIMLVAVTPEARERSEVGPLVHALERAGVAVATVAQPVMDAISPLRSASGLAALATRPATGAERVYRGAVPLVAMAVDVQDPGNVGAIVRVAEAAGASGVVTTGVSANPFGWKALRGSMGSGLRLPIAMSVDAAAMVADARRRGCRIVATTPRGGTPLYQAALTGPLALLIGGEGSGLPPALAAVADERVTIPMQPPVESLNAAVTAALILYEAVRQRSATAHANTGRHENTAPGR